MCAVIGIKPHADRDRAQFDDIDSDSGGFEVRFWGVRGTRAVPGPSTLRYGGNTSCVELRCGNEHLILDAGTGITALGDALDPLVPARNWHLFLSHTHHDHIAGFPFFWPAYGDRHRIRLWAGHLLRRQARLRDVLAHLMHEPYFPVPLDRMHACRAFHDFEAGDELRPSRGIRVLTAPLNHPGGATGYRIEYHGRSVCYVTDVEHREGRLDPVVLQLIQGSGLVITTPLSPTRSTHASAAGAIRPGRKVSACARRRAPAHWSSSITTRGAATSLSARSPPSSSGSGPARSSPARASCSASSRERPQFRLAIDPRQVAVSATSRWSRHTHDPGSN